VSVFDLIILAILAALTLRGIWKGMVSQIVSVASYFVCWIVATRFGSLVAPTIPLEPPWDQVAAMAVVFFVTFIAIRFARVALEKLIKDWHLEKLNKALGGVLGFTKGLFLCLIITFFAVMLSEASRAVVFNSKSGSHLVQLITRISLFVPKDSYEFVHTQFAQFQSKVDEAVPGQTPETLAVQSSETVQQVFAQLGKAEPRTGSLWTALSQWWNGSTDDESETEVVARTPQAPQSVPIPSTLHLPLAVPYTPPVPSPPPALSAGIFANVPPSATVNPAVAVENFFTRQTVASTPPLPEQPLTEQPVAGQLTAMYSAPEVSDSSSLPLLSPLTTLAPLTEILPTSPVSHHVGSDLLLHNSGQKTSPNASARIFQSQ